MGRMLFNRPPRVRPHWPSEQVELPSPPVAPPANRPDRLALVLPLIGAMLMGAAVLGNGGSWWFILPTAAMAGLGLLSALYSERSANREQRAEHAAKLAFFEDQLEAQRTRLHRLYEQECAARRHVAPDPGELLALAGAQDTQITPDSRLWERRLSDDDFLELRVGCGNLPASSQALVPKPGPDTPVDRRLYRLAAEYAVQRQVPITIPLLQLASLGIAGPRQSILPLAYAMLWQAAVLHSPADLRIATLFSATTSAEWEWLRWLPHTIPLSNEPAHSLRMCAGDPVSVTRLMSDLLDQLSRRREQGSPGHAASSSPLLLILIDGSDLARDHPAICEILRYGAGLGFAMLLLVPHWAQIPEDCAAMLDLSGRGARWVRAGEDWPREQFSPDRVDLAQSDRLARRLAAIRLQETGGSQDIPRSVRLFDLLGIRELADIHPPRFWAEQSVRAWCAEVPIGALGEGKFMMLDLNEGRHGPHGIIAGATGAGKSVLLQSIIASLAFTHAPERLQMLLIDFKGGAALSPFAPLPHTAGLVTDLEGRLAERAMTAIKSELRRRKTLLKTTASQYGVKVEHIGDYRALAEQHLLAPLPNLLVIVDEFDEMARSYQDFVVELVRVVKQGRSLGVHLLAATQQPARAVSDEIRSQLTYFIALRLGGSDDSREMILKPDAAFLPTNIPGRAYFRNGNDLHLFQVALVTGVHRFHQAKSAQAAPRVSFVQGGREQLIALQEADAPTSPQPSETDLDLLVRGLAQAAAVRQSAYSQPQIWQPPLSARLLLSAILGEDKHITPCWAAQDAPISSGLNAAIGQLDIPQESRQEPFVLNLAAAHVALIGAPGSGKTMLLRTLLLSLALRYSPAEMWCYLIDAGGQGLGPLAGLPHVAALIQVRERERIQRLIRMLDTSIRERQDRLRAADAPDIAAYRQATGETLPALLVVIDKLAVLREEFRDERDASILDDLLRIARAGRAYGIHLVISADRANDFSYRLLSLFETRIALRQPELSDYADVLGQRVAAGIPPGLAGRALWCHPDHGPLEVQTALPSLEPTDIQDAPVELSARLLEHELMSDLREQVTELARLWQACPIAQQIRPQAIELLPERLILTELLATQPPSVSSGLTLPFGRESLHLSTAALQLNADTPHALLIGARRSGKTSSLIALAKSLAASYSPDQVELLLLDSPRGGLRCLADLAHTSHYACAEHGLAELSSSLMGLIQRAQEEKRSLILLDDYTLCRERLREQLSQSYSPEPNLFATLCEIAQLGGQHGVHLIVAAALSYPDDALLRALDAGRNGLILWPGRYDGGTRLLGVNLPLSDQRNAEQPPGRALCVQEDAQHIVQVAR